MILGIALFNFGADVSMMPMGKHTGSWFTKNQKLLLLLAVAFVIGILITISEPDLSVLATQVKGAIDSTTLVIFVALGVGSFLVVAILKMIFKKSLSYLLMFFYLLLFSIASIVVVNGNENFLPLAFDSGGVTTGPITVPFIMALGVGTASSLSRKDSKENSFGLVALCSVGSVLMVMFLSMFVDNSFEFTVPSYEMSENIALQFGQNLLSVCKEVALALGLIVVFFMLCNFIFFKLQSKELKRILLGVVITYLGLVVFLSVANTIFMPIGYKIGSQVAMKDKSILVILGVVIGALVVLAEPAIHILNSQVDETTNGMISKKSMLLGLTIGVGLAIGLSIIRIIFNFSILYYLVPGYIISLGLSFFVPQIYTAVAFDSGGVASGPLTSCFILPMCVGACVFLQGSASVLSCAFGVVSMVAMAPLITIQLLGFKAIAKKKISRKIAIKKLLSKDDEQIINFM